MLIRGQSFNISRPASHNPARFNSIQTALTANVSILKILTSRNTCGYIVSTGPRPERPGGFSVMVGRISCRIRTHFVNKWWGVCCQRSFLYAFLFGHGFGRKQCKWWGREAVICCWDWWDLSCGKKKKEQAFKKKSTYMRCKSNSFLQESLYLHPWLLFILTLND